LIYIYGVAVDVGLAVTVGVTVPVGVVVTVGVVVVVAVPVVVDVGCVLGVAVGAEPGTAMMVGSGVTGMAVGMPLSNVGVAVGVGPLFSVLWVVLVPPIIITPKRVQTSKTTRITPLPIPI
jgi:hypothetical protein